MSAAHGAPVGCMISKTGAWKDFGVMTNLGDHRLNKWQGLKPGLSQKIYAIIQGKDTEFEGCHKSIMKARSSG